MHAAINYQHGNAQVEFFVREDQAIADLKQRIEDILNDGERPRNLEDWSVAEVTHEVEVVDVPFGDSYVKVTPVGDGTRAALEQEVTELRSLLARIAEIHVEESEHGKHAVAYARAFGKAQGIALSADHIATHVRKPVARQEQRSETPIEEAA